MSNQEVLTSKISISRLHNKYIRYTKKNDVVENITIHLCNLPSKVVSGSGFPSSKIYLTTRTLKHLYDKRPAQLYDFILQNILYIIKYPDIVYNNKGGKRGSKCFLKNIDGAKYFASIEKAIEEDGNYLVTVFTVDEKYLKEYKRQWSWEGGDPHRNDLDATVR
ncbi:hypothetical protein M0R04_03980 [Candidatus Dojkabacteria bacterium]|nr:hypothetical protein [Candidatus Dojkabacteria bacterium]